MIKKLLSSFLLLCVAFAFGQKVEFGVQFQQNQNRIASNPFAADFAPENRFFDIVDDNFDTTEVYMRSYQWDNNFEIPLYLRYQFKNRFFFEVSYSNSVNTLRISGNTNYNNSYFVQNFGTQEQFDSLSASQGLPVDSTGMEYQQYINGYKLGQIREINATEQFKMSTFGVNFGFKLFPHKSIRPFVTAGFTLKTKFRKHRFENLEYDHPGIQNYVPVQEAIDRVKTVTTYASFSAGLEFYRFRFEGFFQGGIGKFVTTPTANERIVNVRQSRLNFSRYSVLGFKLSATIFSRYIGKDVHYDELSDESIAISNIQKKRLHYSLGVRLKRRVLQSLTTFYESSSPLNVLSRDTAIISYLGQLRLSERIQYVSMGEITRANWGPQFELFGDYHFTDRWFVTGTTGFSALSFDVKTREFKAVVVYDSLANATWLENEQVPQLRTGVYRKQLGIISTATLMNYELFKREDFTLRLSAGFGTKFLVSAFYAKDVPAGVNDLALYEDFDELYSFQNPYVDLYASSGELVIEPSGDPNEIISQLPNQPMYGENAWQPPKTHRFSFPYYTLGVETTIDRFSVGLSFEANFDHMDGFMLDDFTSLYFSLGYRLVSH